jgi:Mg-chelatase subunit ChlD
MSDLTKKDPTQTDQNKIITPQGKIRFGQGSALHQRMQASLNNQAKQSTLVAQLPNRIGLMLDVSGSMSGEKIQMCRLAGSSFCDQCDPAETAVAVNTFEPSLRINLSTLFPFISAEISHLHTMGGTPMAEAMLEMLTQEPITRGVIVSDGESTGNDPIPVARDYKDAGIPIDCVHIGDDVGGEETLKQIASITGGVYIKFTNIKNFSKNFKYLTPRYRGLLMAPGAAQLLGANEVKS